MSNYSSSLREIFEEKLRKVRTRAGLVSEELVNEDNDASKMDCFRGYEEMDVIFDGKL